MNRNKLKKNIVWRSSSQGDFLLRGYLAIPGYMFVTVEEGIGTGI